MKKLLITFLLGSIFLYASNIEIKEPYARATPPNIVNSAVFMTLENSSNKDISLIKASSNIAKFVELHTHSTKDGLMTMYEVEKINIPANNSVVLEPASFHIMLIDLNKPLKIADKIELTLEFSDGSKQNIEVEVKTIMHGMKHH